MSSFNAAILLSLCFLSDAANAITVEPERDKLNKKGIKLEQKGNVQALLLQKKGERDIVIVVTFQLALASLHVFQTKRKLCRSLVQSASCSPSIVKG